jgi:hypothetical protein
LADALNKRERFLEVAEVKCTLDAAGIIAQFPIRGLRLKALCFVAR